MPDELFKKIINELSMMNYSEALGLFSNNEPFLDERITDFAKYAREKLPNAFIHLYTNGTLLTFEKFIEIIKYLNYMVIDNYNDDKKINNPELQKIYNYLQEHPELKSNNIAYDGKKVYFAFRLQNEILTSRGGQAPNKTSGLNKKFLNEFCTRLFFQFIIRPTGKISLCCNDALGKYTMGDLNKQTIKEIWNSEEYKRLLNLNPSESLENCISKITNAPTLENENRKGHFFSVELHSCTNELWDILFTDEGDISEKFINKLAY